MLKQWTDFEREDLNMIPTMESAGWKVEFQAGDIRYKRTSIEDPPHNAVFFKKDSKFVWRTKGKTPGKLGWTVADLQSSYYKNHRKYDYLSEVLKNE